MRTTINKNIPISWCIEFDSNIRWFDGEPDERLWIEARNKIYAEKLKVKRMHLFSTNNATGEDTFNGVLTSINPKGIFFCRKVCSMMGGSTMHVHAIGEQTSPYELEVRWYTEDMILIETELRPIENSLIGYIQTTDPFEVQ